MKGPIWDIKNDKGQFVGTMQVELTHGICLTTLKLTDISLSEKVFSDVAVHLIPRFGFTCTPRPNT